LADQSYFENYKIFGNIEMNFESDDGFTHFLGVLKITDTACLGDYTEFLKAFPIRAFVGVLATAIKVLAISISPLAISIEVLKVVFRS